MLARERVKGRVQEIKGKVEQAVGKATGLEKIQARGKVDEAKGRVRGKIAGAKDSIKKMGIGLTGRNVTSIVIAVAGAVIALTLIRRFRAGPVGPPASFGAVDNNSATSC